MKPLSRIFYCTKFSKLILLALMLHSVQVVLGQGASETRVIAGPITLLDTNSIIPESFELNGIEQQQYAVDFAKAELKILDSSLVYPIEITISYRTFPFNFSKPYQHKDESMIIARQRVYNPFRPTGKSQGDNLLDFGDIEKRGSISRGISAGNNQNLSVNSSLNLQLSGRLNERFNLVAAIADQNIPIQPDGNTQQLQDFDQVYIQIFDDNTRITAGDFQTVRNEGYFMQFNKRLQGGRVETEIVPINNDTTRTLKLEASGAVSRGKFARKTIQGVEGNQGPYRLTGAEGEPFIVVLSGTERIFIDGQLLLRGQENDYVINYNTSEITFTAKTLITKDRRIVAEYQYSDRNYARSLVYGSANYKGQRMKLDLAFYTEQDAKNQPLQQTLTDQQKDVLRAAGDSVNRTLASSIDSVGFSENQLLYDRVDTSYFDPILNLEIAAEGVLVYTTIPEKAVYQATFSNVGEGNGNYVFSEQLAFGRVYAWVPPIDGVPQGSFEPVIQLITPKQRQMVTARAEYAITESVNATVEWAGTSNDINTFSTLDQSDDLGMGTKITIDGKQKVTDHWSALGKVDYEFLQKNFAQIERFRDVEFDRDWNIRDLLIPDNQNVLGAEIGAQHEKNFKTIYGIKSFTAGNSFQGIQNSASVSSDFKNLKGNYAASLTNQEGELIKSDYFQHNTLISIPFWKLKLGFKDDLEENKRFDPRADTLSNLSFKWWEWEASIATADSNKNRHKLSYSERTDWLKDRAILGKATFARIYGYEMNLTKMRNSSLNVRVNYRTLDILNKELTSQQQENTLLSRAEYQFRVFKGAISSSTFYEIGSGLENRREFIYIETTPGQGTHIHIDYNNNNEKELDEFELAIQADQVASANYLKVFVPTNEYIKVFRNQFSQALYFRPSAIWRNEKGVRKVISHFSDQFSFAADRKNLELDLIDQFNPFLFDLADSVLQSTTSNLRNIFYFNQSHPVFGADITYQRLDARNLLTSGFESRSTEKTSAGFRWNFTSILGLESRGEQGRKSSKSDAGILSSRNFNIHYQQIEPKLVLQPGAKWRLSFTFNYKEQENKLNEPGALTGGEKSIARQSALEFNLNSPEKGSLLMTGSLVQINYSGAAGSAVGFEMLDGLQPGLNGNWGISYQRHLANNLQINLTYNGRQSPGLRVIHTGGVEARAFF